MGKINFAGWEKCRTFAVAFESESCKQEKHCKCPYTEISPKFIKGERAHALRLYLYIVGCFHANYISFGVREVPLKTIP